jgi:hypothetical protein
MRTPTTALLALTLLALTATAQAAGLAKPAEAVSLTAYNGTWAIKLVCDDFKPDKGPAVKGYTWEFEGAIKDGALLAQYGQAGAPGSAKFVGKIGTDGKMNLQATGTTGEPEYAAGGVGRGSPFTYTMRGRFDASHGSTSRMELRPCRATFTKR